MNSELTDELAALAAKPGSRLQKLQGAAAAIRASGHYRGVGIYDVDHPAGKVVNVAWEGPAPPEHPTFWVDRGSTGRAIAERRTTYGGNVQSSSGDLTAPNSTRSEIVVTIESEDGTVIGALYVESDQPDAFDSAAERKREEFARAIRNLWPSKS